MSLFFLIARAVRIAYKAIRAAVGIMIVAHGTYKWVKSKRQPVF
jgi:hypothetical protein